MSREVQLRAEQIENIRLNTPEFRGESLMLMVYPLVLEFQLASACL